MATMVEMLGTEPTRATLIADCVELINAQVKSKGFMVKGAFAAIKTIKRRFVPEVVDGLLDEWLGKLQVHHDQWAVDKSGGLADYLIARSDEVSEDLLSVTDARAENTSHGTAKKYYFKMRDSAKRDVMSAIPDLARLVERHLAEVQAGAASA